MTDAEVEAKFRDLAERVLPAARVKAALEQLWNIDRATTMDGIFASLQAQ